MNDLQPVPPLKKRKTYTPVRALARAAVDAILDKKGLDVRVIDMHGVSGVADLFVIATGEADLQVRALAEAVREEIRETYDERPWHVEGIEHLQWVVLDYVDLVVHLFLPEKRAFYNLERLWGDAPTENVPSEGSAADVVLLRDPERPASKQQG